MAMIPAGEQPRIFVAGHRGLVGSAIVRRLRRAGQGNLLLADRSDLDLRDQAAVRRWFAAHAPEVVVLAAGTVGGILANSERPAEFLYDNVMIATNVLHAAYLHGTERLLYLGSSCIYPRDCAQPMPEESLLAGPLEPTNEPYAIAKIAGVKLCAAYRRQYGCDFISAMPTNLYGPGDGFDLHSSHVLPALLRKFEEARREARSTVEVWGTGTPRREFLYVDDLADACWFLLQRYDDERPINIGTGSDLSIRRLAELIRDLVAPGTEIVFDASKPDGMPRKLLDVSRLHALGWRHETELGDGVRKTWEWFREHYDEATAPGRAPSLEEATGGSPRPAGAGGRG